MRTSTLLLTACLLAPAGLAADWPQWQGPDRTNVSHETGLLKSWPPGGPKLLWTFDQAGTGYSGPAVVGDRLYTMGAEDGQDRAATIIASRNWNESSTTWCACWRK